jgi:hypothetical protein
MRDEKALRRPEFQPGHKVMLADGQEWEIPKPRLRLRPRFEGGRVVGFSDLPSFGPEHDELVETLFGLGEPEPDAWLTARWEILGRLLRANYDLTDGDLVELLAIDDGPAEAERWAGITRALRGLAPKPLPAT